MASSNAAVRLREILFDGSWDGWRSAARGALAGELPPEAVCWVESGDAQHGLFADASERGQFVGNERALSVPRDFVSLGKDVACYRDHARWHVLYRVLWRIAHGERALLDVFVDEDVHRLRTMAKAVSREGHKMRAFVRFRRVADEGNRERYVAWFEPEHDVVAREAGFFARRFPAMEWSILTPDCCVHWDCETLVYAPGVSRLDAPRGDDLEELWRTYYASTFNPARTKPRMMRSEMPVRYWKHLPEASLIAPLLRDAPGRVQQMVAREGDAPRREVNTLPGGAHDAGVIALDVLEARTRSDRARASLADRSVDAGSSPVAGCDVRVGTASWTDPTMTARGVFYPGHVYSAADRLTYYASRFSLVEVDSTYYALPSVRNARLWVERTPAGFVFDIKAHALMTGHSTETARLPDDIRSALPARLLGTRMVRASDLPADIIDEVWARFLGALEPLRVARKLGALLLQMPRAFAASAEGERALARLRERSGPDSLLAIEFRNASWLADSARRERTLAALRAHDLSYVMVDAPPGFQSSMPRVAAVTSERLAVVRMHGRRTETWEQPVSVTSERYRYLYSGAELAEWVPDIMDVAQATQGVHVVMNNCHANYGTSNADEITELLVEADELRRQMYREGRLLA